MTRCTTIRPPSFGREPRPPAFIFSAGAVVVSMVKWRNMVRSTTFISILANTAPAQRRVPPPNGATPKLFLAGLNQGPGFPNLSCLGLLSDRVLGAELSAAEGSTAKNTGRNDEHQSLR